MPESGNNNQTDGPGLAAAFAAWAEAGKREVISVAGPSMKPFLNDGTRVLVQFGARNIGFGDVVVFHQGETMTIHRIVRVMEITGDELYQTKGDSSFNLDPLPLRERDIVGKVVGIVKGERIIDIDSGCLKGFGNVLAVCSFLVGFAVRICKRALGPLYGSGEGGSQNSP